jgi:transcriptional regulator with XRE-family HTH domain
MLVQKLRLQRGWSQEQLAELSGLSVRTIQRLERGQPASVETLKALGAAFEVDFSELKEPAMNAVINENPSPPNAAAINAEETLALAYVRKLKGFYVNLLQYLVAIPVLAVFNLIMTPHFPWVIFPALGWGMTLLGRGFMVFDRVPIFTAAWERRQVERRLGRKL